MFPVLLGFVALSVDVGYWYVTKRSGQTIADAAALAGARELAKDNSLQSTNAKVLDAARDSVTSNGLNIAGGDNIVAGPPTSGPRAGNTDAVEALVTRPATLFFSTFLGAMVFNVEAWAVSGLVDNGSLACIVALAPNTARALSVSGTPKVTANGCSVQVNSVKGNALIANGAGAELTAEDICVTGGFSGAEANFSPPPQSLARPSPTLWPALKHPRRRGFRCSTASSRSKWIASSSRVFTRVEF